MRAFRSGLIYTAGTAAPVIATLVITPFVTRLLGPREYGTVALAYVVAQAAAILLGLGLPAVITRNVLIEKNGRMECILLVRTATLVVLGISFFGTLGICLAPIADPSIRIAGVAGLWTAFGISLSQMAQAYYRGVNRPILFVVVGTILAVVPNGLGSIVTATVSAHAPLFLAVVGTAQAVVGLGAALSIGVRGIRLSSLREFRHALAIGLPTIPHQASVPMVAAFSVALARWVGGGPAAAQTQVAALLGTGPLVLIQAVNNVWAPYIYSAGLSRRREALVRSTEHVSLLAFLLNVVYAVIAPIAVSFVGGPIAGPNVALISVLIAASTPLFVMYLANIHVTFISGRTWPLALISPAGMVASLSLCWLAVAATGSVLAVAFAWPLFYACQAMSSRWLATKTRVGATPMRRSGLLLLCALVAPLGLFHIDDGPLRAGVASIVSLSACCIVLRTRSKRVAGVGGVEGG